MRPLDGTGEAEPPESGLSLTDHAPPDASEEPAAAEAEETPGPCRGWLCCSSPCAQPVGSLFVKKVQDVHAVEISAFRCVFQMLVIIPCLIYRKTGFIGPKGQRIFLVLRGVLGSTAMILVYYAFQSTSLTDTIVITTAGMDANYSVHLQGTFAALGHALFAAMTLVILRKMGKSVDYFLSIWYYVILGLVESIIVLFVLGEWSLPYCGLDRLFLILIGLSGLGGQVFITKAVQIEKAGPVALMRTMDVVFAFIFQIIFFNDVPTWWTVGGALCVVASSAGTAIRKCSIGNGSFSIIYDEMNCSGLQTKDHEAGKGPNKAQMNSTYITSKVCRQTGYSL
ncbi:Solute Carrier Family 35 Member G1 [Manis pentadactyla]|nr:Solute Carrier Family 35 Member G1 [Manis pentadactyla]